jgi:hypothetical protein
MHKINLFLLTILIASPTWAQTPPESYRPGLGDLMTMTVQPRHTKLGLAGQAGNWAYASYELDELKEALGRIARVKPRWRDFAVAESLTALATPRIAELDAAIKAGDPKRFATAYAGLTDACNQCHTAAGQGVIVIRTPAASPFPDQDFRAKP